MADPENMKKEGKSSKSKSSKRRKRLKDVETERIKRRILEILIKNHEVAIKDIAELETSADYAKKEKELKELIEQHSQTIEALEEVLNTSSEAPIEDRKLSRLVRHYYKDTLCTLDIPIELHGNTISLRIMEMAERWRETSVGDRLGDKYKMVTAAVLATKVVELLKDHKPSISKIFLGSGTTLLKVAEEILRRPVREIDLRWIYTTSILVLDAFLFRKPHNRHLYLLGNEFASVTGALKYEDDLDRLAQLHVDASVLSFTCLSVDAFWVDEMWEKEQMLTLLRPSDRCKLVIIPLEWGKIGAESRHRVKGHRIAPAEVLDCLEDKETKKNRREYVLVTNPPNGNLESDPEKEAVIKVWVNRGITIELA